MSSSRQSDSIRQLLIVGVGKPRVALFAPHLQAPDAVLHRLGAVKVGLSGAGDPPILIEGNEFGINELGMDGAPGVSPHTGQLGFRASSSSGIVSLGLTYAYPNARNVPDPPRALKE